MSIDICSLDTSMSEPIGGPCPNCGHTNLAHPGKQNPSLEECAICALVALKEKINENL